MILLSSRSTFHQLQQVPQQPLTRPPRGARCPADGRGRLGGGIRTSRTACEARGDFTGARAVERKGVGQHQQSWIYCDVSSSKTMDLCGFMWIYMDLS